MQRKKSEKQIKVRLMDEVKKQKFKSMVKAKEAALEETAMRKLEDEVKEYQKKVQNVQAQIRGLAPGLKGKMMQSEEEAVKNIEALTEQNREIKKEQRSLYEKKVFIWERRNSYQLCGKKVMIRRGCV